MKFKSSEILNISRDFFFDIALPILQDNLSTIVNESACGFFGYGSECIGMDKQLGTVSVGKEADMVLVDGNPLEDISILENGTGVKFVMKGGEIYRNEIG